MKFFFILSILLCVANLWAGTYSGGDGSLDSPYEIGTVSDLLYLSSDPDNWDKHFVLTANIDLDGHVFTHALVAPNIGTSLSFEGTPFSGVFDGNGHSISNWTCETTENIHYISLFGAIRGQNAQVKNLTIINPYIDVENAGNVAPLVGYLIQGKVTNCHVKGGYVKGFWLIGGLVGQNDYFHTNRGGIIEKSSSSCFVKGTYTHQTFAGGLVGLNNGKISQSFAIGNVAGAVYVGGLVGKNHMSIGYTESGHIDNSYALGNITGQNKVGGLIGTNSYGEVSYCYSAGTVEATGDKGGLVGEFLNTLGGSFLHCFWDFENSGLLLSAAGTGLTTNDMMSQSTFMSEGWNFTTPLWTVCETNSYPFLAWQNVGTGKYGGGSGSENDPYRIFHGRHLDELGQNSEDWGDYFLLMKNIELSDFGGVSFHIIGNTEKPFMGVFEGTNKHISYFVYNPASSVHYHVGIFGYAEGKTVSFSNLVLIAPIVNGNTYYAGNYCTGSLVGYLKDGMVHNCHVIGGSIYGYTYVGGLIGRNQNGILSDCYTDLYVTGSLQYAGGLVGISTGHVSNCHARGSVSPGSSITGGLIGRNNGVLYQCSASGDVHSFHNQGIGGLVGVNGGTIEQSYSTGRVGGYSTVGGLVGSNGGIIRDCYATGDVISYRKLGYSLTGGLVGYNSDLIEFCYSSGKVEGSAYGVGGLIGWANTGNSTSVYNSYWNINTSGKTESYRGTGLTTSQMKMMISFKGFAHEPIWTINEGVDYPHLLWENKTSQIIFPCWYAGGIGSEEDPYLIQTAQQFNTIGMIPSDWTKSFMQIDNINLQGYNQASLSLIGERGTPFSGIYNGNGYKISNFRYVAIVTGGYEFGLFRSIQNATIKNVRMENPYVDYPSNKFNKAILVGIMADSTVSNCRILNGYIKAGFGTALLVGDNENGLIIDCSAEGTVISTNSEFTSPIYGVGGLVAHNYGQVKRSYSAGTVTGNFWATGGLIGQNYDSVENSYSTTNVRGCYVTGGLVGHNYANILNCYFSGLVSSSCGQAVGGLVSGSGNDAFVLNSFWDITISGVTTSSGGVGLTTKQMENPDTYLAWGGTTWKMDRRKDYPRLFWEDSAGNIIEKLPYAGGVGSPENPYQIATAEQLFHLSLYYEDWDKEIELTNNIVFTKFVNPNECLLGYKQLPFSGVFDGNGFSIHNFQIDSVGGHTFGLFRYVEGEEALISNIIMVDPDLTLKDYSYAGFIVGYLRQGIVDNCHVQGGNMELVDNTVQMGGLVGCNSFQGIIRNCSSSVSMNINKGGGLVGFNIGTIEKCYAHCDITGLVEVGGLVGRNSGQVKKSYFTGNVISTGPQAGGIAGTNWGGSIKNCYAQGTVSGDSQVGGLVGYCSYSTDTLLSHSYAVCQVIGNSHVGGVVGLKNPSIVNRCYWDIDVCDIQTDAGATGMTTAQMKIGANYIGFGCDPVWIIDEGNDYPRLWWEGSNGDLITAEAYSGGCGRQDHPYLISSAHDMNQIGLNRGDWNKYFYLTQDIDMLELNGLYYNPIGEYISSSNHLYFDGVFNGQGFTIQNFNYNAPGISYVALFSLIGPEGQVMNLGLINPDISSTGNWVGGIAGSCTGIIDNCFVSGGSISGGQYTGGIAGSTYKSLIESCSVESTITGNASVGGIVGQNRYSTISNCKTEGIITGDQRVGGIAGESNHKDSLILKCSSNAHVYGQSLIGGIAGRLYDYSHIDECYSVGKVDGSLRVGGLLGSMNRFCSINNSYSKSNVNGVQYVGGLVGYVSGLNSQTNYIRKSYVSGMVEGDSDTGGLLGYINSTNFFYDCFWDSSVNIGLGDSGNIPNVNGITSLAATEMKSASTYLNAGWDFKEEEEKNGVEGVWTICDGTNYPRLSWQERLIADFVCPDGVGLEDFNIIGGCWNYIYEIIGDITNNFKVDYEDLSLLSQYWLMTDCGECGGADLTGNNSVGLPDLIILTQNWLMDNSDCHSADLNKDGTVNILDLLIFADYWLQDR